MVCLRRDLLWLAGGIPSHIGCVLPPRIFAAFVAGLVVDGPVHWRENFFVHGLLPGFLQTIFWRLSFSSTLLSTFGVNQIANVCLWLFFCRWTSCEKIGCQRGAFGNQFLYVEALIIAIFRFYCLTFVFVGSRNQRFWAQLLAGCGVACVSCTDAAFKSAQCPGSSTGVVVETLTSVVDMMAILTWNNAIERPSRAMPKDKRRRSWRWPRLVIKEGV